MYSVNLNDDNKKKNRKDENPFSVNEELAGAQGDGSSSDGWDSADSLSGNNDFASSSVSLPSADEGGKSGAKPFAGIGTGVGKQGPAPLSAREVLGVKYSTPGGWGDYMKRLVPEYTPARATALYAASPKALDDVAGDYFKGELSAAYDKNLDAARVYSNKAYTEYATDPIAAMRIAQDRYNPVRVADETIKGMDTEKVRKMVEPLARRAGYDTDMYIENCVKPALHDMMVHDFIDKNKPKSSAEYILRSAYNNSLLGKAANIGFGRNTMAGLENESLARYDAGRVENFAAGVGSLLIDAPVFAGLGTMSTTLVGKTTSLMTNKLAKNLFKLNSSAGMTMPRALQISERAIMGNLKQKIVRNATMQGLTLGNYDLANSIADDVLYNESVDLGKAAGSFLKGFVTGGATGAVGTSLRKAMGGLTGGRKMLASTGVLSAESAIFTFSTEVDKLMNDVEIEPVDLLHDYAESMATLGVMKMAHWRPKGAANKLKADGTLKDELRLSNSEQAELRELNIDPVELMDEMAAGLRLPSFGIGSTKSAITEKYMKMMQSKDVSASTKAKLMYIVENKLTSTPPVAFDYNVEKRDDGRWVLDTYDFEGNRIERHYFEHSGNVKNYLLTNKGKLRSNRIATYEGELIRGMDSQNLLRQAGLYAREKSVSIDDISQMLYKRAQNMPLEGWENYLLQDILERTSYDRNGMVKHLADVRRGIEKRNGLEEGSLLVKIDEPFYKCSNAENKALDEYEAAVRDEVDMLKKGTDRGRAASFRQMGEESPFKGMSNDEVKAKEVADFYTRHPKRIDAVGSGFKEKPIEIDDSKETGYVWSYGGVDNTVDDIRQLRDYAQELSRKYNFDVEFVSNEREIPYPDVNDRYDVQNYNNKLRAMGWLDNKSGKITINLPNIPSMEDVEKTVVHECVAHGGLQKLFGNHLNGFLEEVYRKSSNQVRSDIGRVKMRYPFADNYTVIEEYLAHLTEKSVLSSGERAVMTGLKDFMKNALVRLNIYTGRNRRVTENELTSLLRQHAKYIERRTHPSKYRRRVFGAFDAAKQDENTYYDREAYEQSVREKIAGGKYFLNTPSELYNTKLLQHYELLPESKKQQALGMWRATDEQVMDFLSSSKYRFDGKKGTLKEMFHDSEFYERYPELANLPVEVVENPSQPLSYDNRSKRLLVDRAFYNHPDAGQLARALQDVVQDYEGFNKAVSMNLFGINSRLGRKYNEAQQVIKALENARISAPDFDRNGDIDRAFAREYGYTPSEFKKRFPTLDEYTLYKLTGKGVPFNDDLLPPASAGEKQHSGSVVTDLSDLMKYFNGPLDVVYRKLQQIHSDEPRKPRTVEESPNDYGYGEFKKREDDRRKRLSDEVEFQKWRDAFRHLDDELDELN